MQDKLIKAAGVALKWKHFRDVHYRLYEVTGDTEGYRQSMKEYQVAIKNWMMEYELTIIAAVMDLCQLETDARLRVKFIAAGYELAQGNDFTIEEGE